MIKNLSQIEAERIIQTLGDGVPVPDYITSYSSEVDSRLLETVNSHLDKVKRGITVARFVKGDYGSGKSHFLYLVREIALRENYIVSYFDLRAREGFDMIERILSKLIKTVSVSEMRRGDISGTVIDFMIKNWITNVRNIEEQISQMPLDLTNRDFFNVINNYCKIMAGIIPKKSNGYDLLELINRWFQAESLRAQERRKIGANNNITARNAREMLDSLAIFFKMIGYSGWVILIDEQEIIPTLMSKMKRNLSNENLKLIIDTQPTSKYRYYLFATTPEFFTDPINGINAYPALRQRVHDVLEIHPINKQEMTEAGKKIKKIYCVAFSDFKSGCISEKDIRHCADFIDGSFANISAKARIFIVSYVKLLNSLYKTATIDPNEEFQSIAGQVWDELEQKEKAAHKRLK